ncbi:hypothetical protein SDC9_112135 [bioreactor metagenome]|uniref:Uncharacterized protein n=1 Tax=bioreactor metagenome TaxID=1076179 RepID=A0A645BIE5_9ZZZZ
MLLGLADHDRPGGRVDVLDRVPDRAEAAGEDRPGERLGVRGEVAQAGEAAEGLAQQRPLRHAQGLPDRLAVVDDLVRTQVREVLRLVVGAQAGERRGHGGLGVPPRGGCARGGRDRGGGDRGGGDRGGGDRGGASGAALVQQHHPVVLQGPWEPARCRRRHQRRAR